MTDTFVDMTRKTLRRYVLILVNDDSIPDPILDEIEEQAEAVTGLTKLMAPGPDREELEFLLEVIRGPTS